jgi:dynein heavy chain 2, cytosolic
LTREEALETAEMMKELRQQWSALQDRITKIYRDCEHFKKDKPKFTYYDKLKEELNDQEEAWSLFEQFTKELNEFGKEDWITYRKKTFYAFQDFFVSWSEKLKAKSKDVVTRFLLGEVDSFGKAWPLIKLCVGESFEKEHWRRLITLLDMPKEVTLDNMKFKHLLDAVPIMLKKSKDIKELSDKAQGEVTIREAIRELRAWCDSAEFVLTDYDNNGRKTPLIKEWKEIMTQVSDNQSLMLSLKESRYF